MNILLINPPRSPYNNILQHAPQEALRFIHKRLIGPPLGLLTIAASVSDYNVSFLEMKGEYDLYPNAPDIEELTRLWVEREMPDIVGVTVIASECNVSKKILSIVKSINPRIVTIAGGLHPTLCPEDFAYSAVDILIQGQAAYRFKKVVQTIEQNGELADIPGLLLNRQGCLVATKTLLHYPDAAGEDFLYPDRSLLKRWISTYKVGGSSFPSTYLFTSLGCPYRCTFCSIWPQFEGRFLQRDVESVIKELKNVPDYPIVRFADANTVVNTEFINNLFDRISEEQIKKEYIMDIRFDTVVKYPHLIEKMAKAGLKVVICGFESFRQEELEKFNKSSSASLIEEAIKIFDDNNIMVRGNYVIQPDYTKEDFEAISDYALSHKVVYAGYTILTPMPGTQLYEDLYPEIIDHNLDKYNFFNCVLKTTMPLEEFYRNVGKLWMIKRGEDVI